MYNVERPRTAFLSTFVNATVSSGSTVYGALCSGSSLNATESARQNIVCLEGKFKCFYAQTSSSQPGSGALVLTVRKNAGDTAVTITIAAGSAAGSFSDSTNSFSVVAGTDVLGVKLVNGASGTSAAMIGVGIFFYN